MNRLTRVILAIILVLVVLGPLSMMFTVSLNPSEEQIQISLGSLRAFVPFVVSGENYQQVLNDSFQPFPRYFLNTVIVVVGIVGLGIVVNSSAAFVLAWGEG